MANNFKKSLSSFNDSLVKQKNEIPGNLGIQINGETTVSVSGRFGFVYVRLRSNQSELIQAFNDKVAQKYDLPVFVIREGNRYIVTRRNTEAYTDWEDNDPYVAKHAETHVFDKDLGNIGGDTVWVHQQQILSSLVAPFGNVGAQNLYVYPYPLEDEDGVWKYTGNTGTLSFLPYRPISGTSVVLVSLDTESGNPILFASTGTYIPTGLTGTSQLLAYIPVNTDSRYLPLSIVRLESGTSTINWDRIYDVRQFINSSGAGGVLGTLTPNRIVITNPTGTITTENGLYYDETNHALRHGIEVPSGGPTGYYSPADYDEHQVVEGRSARKTQQVFSNTLDNSGVNQVLRGMGDGNDPLHLLSGTVLAKFRAAGVYEDDIGAGPGIGDNNVEHRMVTPAEWSVLSRPTKHEFYVTRVSGTSQVPAFDIESNGDVNLYTGTYNIMGIPHSHGASGLTTLTSGSVVYSNQSGSQAISPSLSFIPNEGTAHRNRLILGDNVPNINQNLAGFLSPNQLVIVASGTSNYLSLISYGSQVGIVGLSSMGNSVNPLPTRNDDVLLGMYGNGWGSGTFYPSASLLLRADGNWSTGSSSRGSKISFNITPSGTSTNKNWMTLNSMGLIISGSVSIPLDSTYNINGLPHTHAGAFSGTVLVQDEGVPLGIATVLNFVGSPVVSSISGSVANIFMTGTVGAAGPTGAPGGTVVLFDHYTDSGNSGTSETDLYSDTIAANELFANGDKLEAKYAGLFVSSATATRQLKVKFAGTIIFDSGALTLSVSDAWTLEVIIIRVSATVVRYAVQMTTEGAALSAYTSSGEITGLTLSNTNILKITGQAAGVGAATNDIVAKLGTVWHIQAVGGGAPVIIEGKQRSWFL